MLAAGRRRVLRCRRARLGASAARLVGFAGAASGSALERGGAVGGLGGWGRRLRPRRLAAPAAAAASGAARPGASWPPPAGRVRPGHCLGPLVAQGGQPVGEVPGQGLQQSGELLQRRGQQAGEPSQQHLPGRKLGQGRRLLGASGPCRPAPPLEDQQRVGAGVVPQRLGHGGGVAVDEGDSRSGRRAAAPGRPARIPGRPAGPACSCRSCSRRRWGAASGAGPARSLTLRPRYSVRMAPSASWNRRRTSSTTATFSGLGLSIGHLLLLCRR